MYLERQHVLGELQIEVSLWIQLSSSDIIFPCASNKGQVFFFWQLHLCLVGFCSVKI